ncbi:MAG: GAF domain-containing protein [Elusimicrobia bacterium]|nr:GAF domain-containing protein [Elusimicrobiota bacterium]
MNDKFLLFLDANRLLTSTFDIKKLLTIIMELASKVVNAEASSLLLLDEDTKELYFDVAIGEKADEVKRVRLKPGEGIAGWCAAHNRSLIVEDVTKDARWTKRSDESSGFETKSIICVPMRCKGRILGVIEGINARGREFFTDEDLPFFEAFANQAAVALENARLFTKLTQENEKISAAFNGMSDAVFVTDGNGKIVQSNKPACDLVNSEDFDDISIEKVLGDAGFIFPEELLKFENKTKVFEITKKTGKQLILNCLATRITGDNDKVFSYIFVIRDITEEKEEYLLHRSFLSLISHKLKTPLVSITGYISILSGEKLSPSQHKAIKVMKNQSERLTELVTDLLRFTVVDTEVLNLEKKKIPVKRIISEALGLVRKSLKAAEVNTADLSKLGSISVDKEKIKEAVGCVLENAVKFNKQDKKIINISGDVEGDNIILNIEDNGVGIALSEKQKIFENFYQIEESFTGQVEGSGLGLPLARRIISAHGGSIDVASKVGKGSKFIIKIPKSRIETHE